MSWTVLEPVSVPLRRAEVSLSVQPRKYGGAVLHINIRKPLHEALGRPERVRVLAGDGDHSGLLRLEFSADGPFRVVRGTGGGGGRVCIPRLKDMPDEMRPGAECVLVERDLGGGAVVLRVPAELLGPRASASSSVAAPAPVPRPAPPAPAARLEVPVEPKLAPAPTSRTDDDRIDAVAYLKGKGHDCHRLADGRFTLKGEPATINKLLMVINAHRKHADLPPLPLNAIK